MAANGRYVCDGQPPLVVVDGGDLPDGMHGPWVKYRFEWERDDQAVAVLWMAWDALVAVGYRLESA